jgi:hypothetical protein
VFRVSLFSQALAFLNCRFSPVAYVGSDQVVEIINEIIDNVMQQSAIVVAINYREVVQWIFWTLVMAVTCIKHEGFDEEKEWRVIYQPSFQPSTSGPLLEEETTCIGGVPQVIYKMPIDDQVAIELADIDVASMFDRLIIGPTSQPWVMYEAFTRVLGKAGVADAGSRVIASGIPLRSW